MSFVVCDVDDEEVEDQDHSSEQHASGPKCEERRECHRPGPSDFEIMYPRANPENQNTKMIVRIIVCG